MKKSPKNPPAYRELLLGCGHSRHKKIPTGAWSPAGGATWRNLATLDFNPDVKPDLVCDIDSRAWFALNRLGPEHQPCVTEIGELRSDYFDEVHAYEVLEHIGAQGDYRAFFAHFSEIWRLLRSGGLFCATVPSRFSEGLWGDPGHRRAIVPMSLVFLDQSQYILQCDREKPTSMSDYRNVYSADFRVLDQHDDRHSFRFVLQAVKPSRWAEPNQRK
jgi:hypothetical protein